MSTPKPHHQIDYIELATPDVASTKAFFEAVFGWKFEDYGPDYTSFSDGRLSGGFYRSPDAGSHGILLVIYSVDLAATQRKIVEAGGRIVKDTFSFPGGRRFHFAGPDGHELAVWSE